MCSFESIKKFIQFLRERQAVGTTIIMVLQGSESRTLSVVFSPHHLGAAIGKIVFKHYESKRDENESRPSKVVNILVELVYLHKSHGNFDPPIFCLL